MRAAPRKCRDGARLRLARLGLTILVNVVREVRFSRHTVWSVVFESQFDDFHGLRWRLTLAVSPVVPNYTVIQFRLSECFLYLTQITFPTIEKNLPGFQHAQTHNCYFSLFMSGLSITIRQPEVIRSWHRLSSNSSHGPSTAWIFAV